jgi:hypothetical protein
MYFIHINGFYIKLALGVIYPLYFFDLFVSHFSYISFRFYSFFSDLFCVAF